MSARLGLFIDLSLSSIKFEKLNIDKKLKDAVVGQFEEYESLLDGVNRLVAYANPLRLFFNKRLCGVMLNSSCCMFW